MSQGDWLVTWQARPDARVRLLCLGPAGGSAGQFRSWSRLAPADIEVTGVELPGRGYRSGESPMERMDDLVDALADVVVALPDRPLAIFGHSMGALVGTELAHRLRSHPSREPVALVAASCRAPGRFYARERVAEPTEAEVVETLRRQGGVRADILESPKYRAMLLAPLRGDIALIERHHPPARDRLDCPVFVYTADDDDQIDPADVEAWRHETTGVVGTRRFPAGGHHFVVSHAQSVIAAVGTDLAAVSGSAPAP